MSLSNEEDREVTHIKYKHREKEHCDWVTEITRKLFSASVVNSCDNRKHVWGGCRCCGLPKDSPNYNQMRALTRLRNELKLFPEDEKIQILDCVGPLNVYFSVNGNVIVTRIADWYPFKEPVFFVRKSYFNIVGKSQNLNRTIKQLAAKFSIPDEIHDYIIDILEEEDNIPIKKFIYNWNEIKKPSLSLHEGIPHIPEWLPCNTLYKHLKIIEDLI